MCAEFEILLRKNSLSNDDVQFVSKLLTEKNFGFSIFHYNEENTHTTEEYVKKIIDGIRSNDETNQFLAEQLLYSFVSPRSIRPKTREEVTEKEKNSVIFFVSSYQNECLCSLNDQNLMRSIFNECLPHFDEVFYDPSSNGFATIQTLGSDSDKVVSVNDTDYDFSPSMNFRPFVKIMF